MTARRLEGRVCLVTGGSRGLGREIGLAMAAAGAQVAFTYSRSDADAADAADAIAAAGGSGLPARPMVFKGDVADAAHAARVVGELVARYGRIDALVNNVGTGPVLPLALLEEPDWDRMMGSVKGAYLFSRAALRHMIRARRGSVLSIGSFASERIVDTPVHYAAAKSALRGFTEALAREVGRYGITVNLLAPGVLDVGMGLALPQHRLDEYLQQCPLGRVATAAEVARAAVFLVSDDARLVSGAKVLLDGGL